MRSGFIREVNKGNILHKYEYASDKEMKTYTVWDAYQSLYDIPKCIEKIINQYEEEKLPLLEYFILKTPLNK
ncbi:hypothetical protein BAQ48_14870 [Bacillus luti]|nr:hypothetical protein BAQ48_14870 [Bacillus luti]